MHDRDFENFIRTRHEDHPAEREPHGDGAVDDLMEGREYPAPPAEPAPAPDPSPHHPLRGEHSPEWVAAIHAAGSATIAHLTGLPVESINLAPFAGKPPDSVAARGRLSYCLLDGRDHQGATAKRLLVAQAGDLAATELLDLYTPDPEDEDYPRQLAARIGGAFRRDLTESQQHQVARAALERSHEGVRQLLRYLPVGPAVLRLARDLTEAKGRTLRGADVSRRLNALLGRELASAEAKARGLVKQLVELQEGGL